MQQHRGSAGASYSRSLKKQLWRGLAAVALFFGAGGYWAAVAPISGAVVAHGQLVVGSNVKKVQHPTGGVVGDLRVKDGDHVKAGDVLLKLDETITRAALEGITKKLDELSARAARLEAERYGYRPLEFPDALTSRQSDPLVNQFMTTERDLYNARRDAHALRKSRLEQRVAQLEQEITGLQHERDARVRQAAITKKELAGLRQLDDQKLVQIQRLNAIEKEAVSLEGQHGQLLASLAQAEGRIVETEMQMASLDDELRVETTNELREVQAEIAQLEERRIAAQDQLDRVEIRAPSSGRVHQSTAHTVGGVITPGEVVMLIVPEVDALELEARVNPPDIDQVHVGQEVKVHLQAFNRRTTPTLSGQVSRIAADVTKDQQTGALYYVVRVKLSTDEMAKLGELHLSPGMLADAFIKTSDRTALDFLLRPVTDQLARAFKER